MSKRRRRPRNKRASVAPVVDRLAVPRGAAPSIFRAQIPHLTLLRSVEIRFREYLLEPQNSVREIQVRLAGKMDRPHTNFAAGNLWVGPTAESWGSISVPNTRRTTAS